MTNICPLYDKVTSIGVAKLPDDSGTKESVHGDFSPVEAYFPVEVKMLAGAEQDAPHTRLTTEMNLVDLKELPEHDDKVLSAWLKMLNLKLEAIIGLLDKEREEFRRLPYRKLVISGGGITVALPGEVGKQGKFELQGLVEMKLLLPSIPPVAMYVYGRVVDFSAGTVSARFLPMDEELRDRIVHYVFLRQREIFREQRETRGMGD